MAGKSKALKWYGPAVTKKMRAAQIEGVNKTLAACVVHAKRHHSWQNRTAVLEGGINIADYAKTDGAGVKGTWGVQDVVYARIHELGGVIRPKTAVALFIPQSDGSLRRVQSVTIKKQPYLRPAADEEYPKLGKRIRQAFEKS